MWATKNSVWVLRVHCPTLIQHSVTTDALPMGLRTRRFTVHKPSHLWCVAAATTQPWQVGVNGIKLFQRKVEPAESTGEKWSRNVPVLPLITRITDVCHRPLCVEGRWDCGSDWLVDPHPLFYECQRDYQACPHLSQISTPLSPWNNTCNLWNRHLQKIRRLWMRVLHLRGNRPGRHRASANVSKFGNHICHIGGCDAGFWNDFSPIWHPKNSQFNSIKLYLSQRGNLRSSCWLVTFSLMSLFLFLNHRACAALLEQIPRSHKTIKMEDMIT